MAKGQQRGNREARKPIRVRRQSFPERLSVFLTEVLARRLFQFMLQRSDAAIGIC